MKKITLFLPLLLLIHLILLILLRFTAWPEMVLWPYLLNKGLIPYQDIVVIYPPGLILALSFLGKLFGVTLMNLKIYTWVFILVTDLLIYWIAKRLTQSKKIAILSLLFYVLWQPFFEGNAFWFDLVLAPLGLLLFYFAHQKKFFWSGFIFGLALTVKQTTLWFLPPLFLTFWLIKEIKIKPFLLFIFGMVMPLGASLIYLVTNNLFDDFLKWAVSFGVFYLPKAPGQIQLPTLKQTLSLLIPFAVVFLSFFTILQRRNIVKREWIILLIFWTFFASLGVLPRFEYFHFQPSLPFLAVLSGIFISSINISPKKLVWFVFLALVTLGTVYLQLRFYRLNWQKPTRFFETDILEIAKWLRENTQPDEKIYILNSWDHLYALSETLPAVSPLIHTLPWHLEYPGMQEKYVADLTKVKPRIVVFQPYKEKGLGSYKPEKIDKFVRENYSLKEIIAGRFLILERK